ncbi:MAG: N-acetylneuraminate synthase family protein [Kiloniellaceae bacterium]
MSSAELTIAGHPIGADHPPFVIAEAGSNFNQSLDIAKQLIDVAAESGAQAVKFQLFRAEALYPPGTEMHAIFKSVELNADWLAPLSSHAKARGILFAASVFDRGSLEALEAVGVPFHKVASSETTNLPLLGAMAATGKPLLISTGMCELSDIAEAVTLCRGTGNDKLVLLQCGSLYPLPPEKTHLRALPALAAAFDTALGFSDHTLGMAAGAAAVALGARVIEKHFTLSRAMEGPDHSYALEPGELKAYVATVNEAYAALGSPLKGMLPEERAVGRRNGLYAARAIAAGAEITAADVAVKRPAVGIDARYAGAVVGAKAAKAIDEGEAIAWGLVDF